MATRNDAEFSMMTDTLDDRAFLYNDDIVDWSSIVDDFETGQYLNNVDDAF